MSRSATMQRPPEPRDDAAALTAKPPVDLSRLRRFTLGNLDLEQELLGLFATQAPIMLDALRRADTAAAWRDAGHTMRGSSASIGAWLVAEAAERAERLVAKPAEWDQARRDVAAAVAASLDYVAQVSASNRAAGAQT
jgi:HPt (histidine-containing phosphotransfer) domain-containing protein